MRKIRVMVLGALSALVLVATPSALVGALGESNPQSGAEAATHSAAAAAPSDCKRQSAANSAGQDILLSTALARNYTGTTWKPVTCTETTFRLKYNERALVVANFNAEADCQGNAPTNGQWCETRALLNSIEGSPIASEPSSFAFDNVSGGLYNWQAHSMNRGWEVRCSATAGCQYKFMVQTKMHNTTATSMWLDEVAAHLRVTIGAGAPL